MQLHQSEYPVGLMCQLLEVGRSSFYEWQQSTPSARSLENQHLASRIQHVFMKGRSSYGTRRIKKELQLEGVSMSRRRIGKLMKQQGLQCKTKRKFKVTTDSKHKLPIAPNLLGRDFTATQPDQKYVGDITYIWTIEGWIYLAVVIDLFSRRVVGWAMEDHMQAELVNDALTMAIWTRKPMRGLLWHTDRGSQYASESHKKILDDHGIVHSMSRKGNCWDNAVSESFFHTLKTELTHHCKFPTREEAKKIIFEYIEVFYNRKRLHSANDYMAPAVFEAKVVNY
ncbi:MAG: IS3 family transposase [Gammaproteobacteria bacterium]